MNIFSFYFNGVRYTNSDKSFLESIGMSKEQIEAVQRSKDYHFKNNNN